MNKSTAVSQLIRVLLEVAEKPDAKPTSIWIGFTLTPHSVVKLWNEAYAIYGDDVNYTTDQFHLTLRYISDVKPEDISRIQEVISGDLPPMFDQRYILKPLTYEVFGKDNCLVARYDSHGLQDLHYMINEILRSEGLDYKESYPEYKPHVALGNNFSGDVRTLPDGSKVLIQRSQLPPGIELDELYMKQGNNVLCKLGTF